MGYGLLLILLGGIGYLSNPEKAQSALITGSLFGALYLLLGWRIRGGSKGAYWNALVTLGFLSGTLAWRASLAWNAYMGGASEKLLAACLISVMLGGGLWLFGLLLKNRKSVFAQL